MLGGAELARQKSEQEQAGQLKALRDCAASEAQTGGLLAELEATRAKIARLRGQATRASERRSDSSPCRTGRLRDRALCSGGAAAAAAAPRAAARRTERRAGPSRADMMLAEMELKKLVAELDGPAAAGGPLNMWAAASAASGAGGSRPGRPAAGGELDYNEEARKLFAAKTGAALGSTPNVNPIWRHPKTGATVFVGNNEAAGDSAAGGLLETLSINHIIDCRVTSKDRCASGDEPLPAGAALPPARRRRFRFEIENYWRFCWADRVGAEPEPEPEPEPGPTPHPSPSPGDAGGLVSNCPGCQTASTACKDPSHTRLLDSNEGVQALFAPVFGWIDTATANGHNVLIHCLAGAHREQPTPDFRSRFAQAPAMLSSVQAARLMAVVAAAQAPGQRALPSSCTRARWTCGRP